MLLENDGVETEEQLHWMLLTKTSITSMWATTIKHNHATELVLWRMVERIHSVLGIILELVGRPFALLSS